MGALLGHMFLLFVLVVLAVTFGAGWGAHGLWVQILDAMKKK